MVIEEKSRNIHVLRDTVKSGWKQDYLLCSDIHFDSVHCNRDLLRKHFNQAKEKNARIVIDGDWFDLMQGRYDPRRNYQDIRPEYKSATYLDDVIEDSVEFLKSYVDNIVILGYGNHETAIIKNAQTDPLERLITLLNFTTKAKVHKGGYSGWLVLHMGRTNGSSMTRRIKYHHGTRGNARRSKGILEIDIDSGKWPDADVIIKGDNHQKWYYPATVRERISASHTIYEDVQHFLRLGSYADAVGDGFNGWHVEKDFQRSKLGGWWMNLSYLNDNIDIEIKEAS